MQRLSEVENAKALMSEAMTWSVMKWLREKKRVRQTADRANAVLDQLNRSVKDRWADRVRTAYDALGAEQTGSHVRGQRELSPDPEAMLLAKKVKEADELAQCARMDAETTFDDAERQLSTSLAREGCRKAIASWELHEKAIRKAESLIHQD